MKHILITGGNAGIGKATAIALGKKGDRIILAARNKSKAEKAVNEIKKATSNDEIYSVICDLSDFASIRNCSEKIKKQFSSLDILINNAGVVTDKLQFTKEGFELQIGVNHLGHFLLTTELLKMISAADDPRIINVSSNAHFNGKINFDTFKGDLGGRNFKGMAAYAQSKLANVLFTKELANRYPGIMSHSLHPGVVRTNIANKNDNSRLWQTVWSLIKPFLLSPEKGAKTSIYLAQSKDAKEVNGQYYHKRKVINASALANDMQLAKKLWEESSKLVAG